jgi:hypothetical protein
MTTKTKVNITFALFAMAFVGGLVFKFLPGASVENTGSLDVEAQAPTGSAPQAAANPANGLPMDRKISVQNPGGGSAPQMNEAEVEELSEEDKLAKVDPVWRKTWEHYKRMFILAQQMRQQPPAKPTMPHARHVDPDPPPPVRDEDGDDDPNPFRFPEE